MFRLRPVVVDYATKMKAWLVQTLCVIIGKFMCRYITTMTVICNISINALYTQILACLGIMSDGMQFGWPSPAILKLRSTNATIALDKIVIKSITNVYILGNMCGLIISIVIFKRLSRKVSLIISSLPILIGWLGILISRASWMILFARFIGGIGRNMIYVVVPMYIGEIADPNIRGVLSSFIYSSMNIGVILVYALTPYFPVEVSPITGLTLAFVQLLLIFFIPESPYYFLTQNKVREAEHSLKILRQRANVDNELSEISEAVLRHTSQKSNTSQLFKVSSNRKALSILSFLRFVQMFSGVSVMTMHIHSIFQKAGGNFTPEKSALIYAILMMFSCFCTMSFTDKFGRKTLMIFSCTTTASVLISQGIYLYSASGNLNWLPLTLVIAYVFTYRIGLGTVPMIMIGELFPTNVKVAGVVVSDLIYSVSSLLSNIVFQYTNETFGMHTPFFVFGGVCIVASVLSMKYVPETRNRTLEEIQMILRGKYDATKLLK